MTSFSPEFRPLLSSALDGALSVSELNADNEGKELCGVITRTLPEVIPAKVAAHHPETGPVFLSKFSDSSRRTFILVLAFVALFLATSPATSQMTGDLELALKMQKAGKLTDAIEVYSEVIKKNPKSAEAYNWRGIAYDDLGQTDKALQDFSKAIEISPNYADAHNNRGEIYRKKQMNREAITDYMRAVQLEPNFAEAHYNLGMVNELEKRFTPAATGYENYLKHKPDAPDKSEIEAKIKTLRQAAAAQPRPGSPPVAQKPGEPTPAQPQAAPRPAPPGTVKPPAPAKPARAKWSRPWNTWCAADFTGHADRLNGRHRNIRRDHPDSALLICFFHAVSHRQEDEYQPAVAGLYTHCQYCLNVKYSRETSLVASLVAGPSC